MALLGDVSFLSPSLVLAAPPGYGPIRLQFSALDSLASELIEWFGHGVVSHVDVVLPSGRLMGARKNAIRGIPAGVQSRPADYANFTRKVRVDLPAPPEVVDSFYSFISAQNGKPYDEKAIEAFLPGRDWRTPDAWFCSELVAAGLETSKWFAYPLATSVNKITPPDLLLVLSAFVPISLSA